MLASPTLTPPSDEAYRHEALLYAGQDEFLAGTLAFIRTGLAAQEPILVVISQEKIDALREALGDDAANVHFAEMGAVGRNPARIIPAWRRFIDEHGGQGQRVWGIGEPIFPSRSAHEMVECHRHESLLNLAFADTPGFWLLCPYDTEALDPEVIEEAQRNHPFVMETSGAQSDSAAYTGLEAVAAPFAELLPDPPAPPDEMLFDADTLDMVRAFVRWHAADAGIVDGRLADLVVAVNEVATNSVRHAGGQGTLRLWEDGDALVCEVTDDGHIDRPLVGRELPVPDQVGGYGLWMANQLCELVQLRSFRDGSTVRLHFDRRG